MGEKKTNTNWYPNKEEKLGSIFKLFRNLKEEREDNNGVYRNNRQMQGV